MDTNVYLHDPKAMHNFQNNTVLIPFEILEELDNLKNRKDNVGYNARIVIRELSYYENLDEKNFIEFLDSSKIVADKYKALYNSDGIDNKLLAICLSYPEHITLISKDINLRLKAKAVGVEAQDYYSDKVDLIDLEKKSRKTILLPDSTLINEIYKEKKINKEKVINVLGINSIRGLYNNLSIIFQDQLSKQSALTYYRQDEFHLINTNSFKKHGIEPINTEQAFALQYLFIPEITGVAIFGSAGSGKTYISLASALAQLGSKYKKIIITKPVVPVGREIGWLPGDILEKMSPWLASYMDNLSQLIASNKYDSKKDAGLESISISLSDLIDDGIIEIQPITYIRGRNFVDSFIIIDEAHNLTMHEIKTVLTRIGNNSKVVLLGDIEQIDTTYLDKYSNGLVQAISKLRGIPEFAYVKFDKVLRSKFVEQVVKLL